VAESAPEKEAAGYETRVAGEMEGPERTEGVEYEAVAYQDAGCEAAGDVGEAVAYGTAERDAAEHEIAQYGVVGYGSAGCQDAGCEAAGDVGGAAAGGTAAYQTAEAVAYGVVEWQTAEAVE
jgi:hypothetical protein